MQANVFIGQVEFPQNREVCVFQLVNPLSFKNKRNKGNCSSRKKISKTVYATVSMMCFNLLKQGLDSYHRSASGNKSEWKLSNNIVLCVVP